MSFTALPILATMLANLTSPEERVNFNFLSTFTANGTKRADFSEKHFINENPFVPYHYDLHIRLPLRLSELEWMWQGSDFLPGDSLVQFGTVKIFGIMSAPTKWLSFKYDTDMPLFTNNTVQVVSKRHGQVEVIGSSSDSGVHKIQLNSTLQPGYEIELSIQYVHVIFNNCNRLWAHPSCREEFTVPTGETEEYFMSSPNHYQVFFPTIDQDKQKTTFDLTLIHKTPLKPLFNTDIVSQSDLEKGWTQTKFERTLKVFPTVLGLFLSQFESEQAPFGNKTAKVHAPPHWGTSEDAQFMANKVASLLNFYEDYFEDISRIPKIDIVISPNVRMGWLTWGLIVYESGSNLPTIDYPYDNRLLRALDTHRETMRLSYILAEQWMSEKLFSEKSYMTTALKRHTQFKSLENLNPDKIGTETAILRDIQFVFNKDSSEVPPLSEELSDFTTDIDTSKGTPLLRMLEDVLSPPGFRSGIQRYLKRMEARNGNVSHEDLFECLEDSEEILPEGVTVPIFMHNWADQSGYPVVQVRTTNKTHLVLTQVQFGDPEVLSEELGWYIPVRYETRSGPGFVWLEENGKSVAIEFEVEKDAWLFVNPELKGYYRVLYDEVLLHQLNDQLISFPNQFSPLGKAQLLSDSFALASQGRLNFSSALNLTRYLGGETHLGVWRTVIPPITELIQKFTSHSSYSSLTKFFDSLVESALLKLRLGEYGGLPTFEILRRDLLLLSCTLRSPSCERYVSELFEEMKRTPESTTVDSDFFCGIVATGGQEAFDFFYERRQDLKFLTALGCVTEKRIILELLNKTLDDDFATWHGDAGDVLQGVAKTPQGQSEIMPFLSSNVDKLLEISGESGAYLVVKILETLSSHFHTEAQAMDMINFVEAHKEKFANQMEELELILLRVDANIAWMSVNGKDIVSWLSKQ